MDTLTPDELVVGRQYVVFIRDRKTHQIGHAGPPLRYVGVGEWNWYLPGKKNPEQEFTLFLTSDMHHRMWTVEEIGHEMWVQEPKTAGA